MRESSLDHFLRHRLDKVALLVFACSLLVLGLLPETAKALPPVGWTYCYDRYSGGLWVNSQSTYHSARWWPAPGYTSSSSYYRLGSNWYVRFNSNYTWCNGAYADQADRRSKATHELGHAIRLKDLDGDPGWTFSIKPTMYGFWGTGTIGERDLAAGDLTGIRQLY